MVLDLVDGPRRFPMIDQIPAIGGDGRDEIVEGITEVLARRQLEDRARGIPAIIPGKGIGQRHGQVFLSQDS
jgi:hypothetical protein